MLWERRVSEKTVGVRGPRKCLRAYIPIILQPNGCLNRRQTIKTWINVLMGIGEHSMGPYS